MKQFLSILTICSIFMLNGGCSKDDHEHEHIHEEEVITTVTVTLTPKNSGRPVTLRSKDTDGNGPKTPTITGGTLQKGMTYTGSIELLNETENPAENITEEVAEEAEEHQFFYKATGIGGTFTYTGKGDKNGKPVGLTFEVVTGSMAGSGHYTITLRHSPNKSASGVSTGDITNAEGETDVEVKFPITLQ